MNILAIDTSSTSGSVALEKDGKIGFMGYTDIQVTHSERLMPMLEHGLRQAKIEISDLDAVAITNGPGSFTGIRIGLATAKALCYAHKIPLIPLYTTQVLAANVYGTDRYILPAIDAKMNEIYSVLYTPQLEIVLPAMSTDPASFFAQIDKPVIAIGDGILKYEHLLQEMNIDYTKALFHQNFILASTILSLIDKNNLPQYDFDFVASLEPYYLRKSQAEVNRVKG